MMMARVRAAALAVSVLALTACAEAEPPDERGAEAPDYVAVTLDGDSIALADLRGEVVLLNVWATWCVPCRVEIPELQALHEAHAARGLRVVGVTVDSRAAGDDVVNFIDEFGMTYDIWTDPDHGVLNRFRASGVPITVLIDRGGRIAWRHVGMFERGDPDLLRALDRTLAET